MKMKKGDFIVIAFIMGTALLLMGLQALPAASGTRMLRVELDGTFVRDVAMDEDHSFAVDLPGGQATVEIVAGRVRILKMPRELCPLGICSSVGWVERTGDAIVCLPNRLVLTVMGGEADQEWESVDGVTK